jgi:NADH-quinone oxidoreductase subunit D
MAYLLPVGPWHPALDEPVVYKLEVAGSKIENVEIELGFNHRGVEKLLPCLLPHQILAPVGQICGKCSFANTLAVATVLEKLAGLEPSGRSEYLRLIAAELERAASHLSSMARTLRMLGIQLSAARLEQEAEGVRQLLAATGNRVYDTFSVLGGAMRAPQISPDFLTAVENLRKNIYESANQLLDNRQLERRTVGVGLIDPADTLEWSLTGPIARAAELALDTRRTDPYAAYREIEVRVVTQRRGDLFARLAVRALESLESLNLVSNALRNLPEGGLHDELLPPLFPAEQEAFSLVETPRGQLLCYAATDETGKLARLKLRPPTLANMPALALTLPGQEADDAAAIIASLDFCFSCAER